MPTNQSPIKGLTNREADKRSKIFGPNIIFYKTPNILIMLLKEFINPLIILLIIAGFISFVTNSIVETIVIALIVNINIIIGLFHKYKSQKVLQKLICRIPSSVNIFREGELGIFDKKDIVPGDYLQLTTGDVVPADCKILSMENLLVDESILTGESNLVSKSVVATKDNNLNLLFAGTNIKHGQVIGFVTKTANETQYGEIAGKISQSHKSTLYEQRINTLSKDLIYFALVFLLLILTLNLLFNKQERISEILLFIIAISITLVPEGLPAIASITLAHASEKLFKKGIFIKHLASIEDLGNIDIICTDKTGTLTKNLLSVVLIDNAKVSQSDFYKYLAIISTQSNDPFDMALDKYLIDKTTIPNKLYFKEESFDPKLKFSKRIFNDFEIIKGIPEVVLIDTPKKVREKLILENSELSKRGWRSLAYGLIKHKKIQFLGYVYFGDQIKPEVKETIRKFREQNIAIKVITGDSFIVSQYVAKKIGLISNSSEVVNASELNFEDSIELTSACERYSVFCRVNPLQKELIISALIRNKHHVGYLGDGINDAPSLEKATVSIVVSEASEIAKQATDIVIMKKNLELIFIGIFEGRKTFENIDKYIKHVLVGNFGNFFTLGVISLFLNYLPMLPLQILISNLIIDMCGISFAFDNVDSKLIKKPHIRNFSQTIRFSILLGVITSILDIILFLFIKGQPVAFVQTIWFATSAIAEILFIFSVRTNRLFTKSIPAKITIFTAIFGTFFILLVTFIGFPGIAMTNTLNIQFIPIVLLISLFYFIITELSKLFIIKNFDE